MKDFLTTHPETRAKWWMNRRKKFNYGLVTSVIVAYCGYLVLAFGNVPNFDLTTGMWPLHMLFLLAYIGIANLFDFLGAVLDKSLNTYNDPGFRVQLYVAGGLVACSIPVILTVWFYISLP